MSRAAVFGYASLVSRASAAQTLGRPVDEALPSRLGGWARRWTLARDNRRSEKTFARSDGTLPRYCLGLNLESDEAAPAPNGVLIAVDEGELERLDLRELRYHRVEVTDRISERGEFEAIFAYTARPEHHFPTAPRDSIIVATYPAAVEAAFAELGAKELELYRRTTAPAPVAAVEATLVGDRIPAGNPRAW